MPSVGETLEPIIINLSSVRKLISDDRAVWEGYLVWVAEVVAQIIEDLRFVVVFSS